MLSMILVILVVKMSSAVSAETGGSFGISGQMVVMAFSKRVTVFAFIMCLFVDIGIWGAGSGRDTSKKTEVVRESQV